MERRASDDWDTIVVRSRGGSRDALPGDMGGRLGSPGVRALEVGAWTMDRKLTFHYHCGTGCVGIYEIEVDSGALREIWTGGVDAGMFWSPRRDRVAIGLPGGGLLMLKASGERVGELPGCRYADGKAAGERYIFKHWFGDGSAAAIRRAGCADEDAPGALMVWRPGGAR